MRGFFLYIYAKPQSQILRTRRGEIEFALHGNGPAVIVYHGTSGGYDQGLDLASSLCIPAFENVPKKTCACVVDRVFPSIDDLEKIMLHDVENYTVLNGGIKKDLSADNTLSRFLLYNYRVPHNLLNLIFEIQPTSSCKK